MYYEWKICPIAWQGDFGDRDGKKSIILEAIADGSLHIWHAFFGIPGSNNSVEYNRYYLLANGIYPPWPCFVQTIHLPPDEKRAYFASRQEAVRKDVERCFEVLQARFAIIKNPSRHWNVDFISNIMFTCCILHNMILEDEQDVEGLEDIIAELQQDAEPLNRGLSFQELLAGSIELENSDTYFNLRSDLIEHLWRLKGLNMA
jgi:hypothetical protein